MMRALRIETVRGRLTAFYIIVLAAALIIVGGLIYVLLAQALYAGSTTASTRSCRSRPPR